MHVFALVCGGGGWVCLFSCIEKYYLWLIRIVYISCFNVSTQHLIYVLLWYESETVYKQTKLTRREIDNMALLWFKWWKDPKVSFISTIILTINLESLMSNLKGRNPFAKDNYSQLYFMSALSYEGHVWVHAGKNLWLAL